MNVKEEIVATAKRLGFNEAKVASLEPMETARVFYEEWLSNGYAATMDYLKRNPHFRTSPALLVPNAKCALIVSVNYYTEPGAPPDYLYGRVARYAVGQDYHRVIRAKLRQLRDEIEKQFAIATYGKAFTDDVALFEPALAKRHGVGFTGKNSLIIGPRLNGSYNLIGELFLSVELEPDLSYKGTCGQCVRCSVACPTKAIVGDGVVDANRCISFLTIENKGGIPLEFRQALGDWVFGCDICQEVCPYNRRPSETPWTEFQPGSGTGHYLNLLEVLRLNEDEFRAKFVETPLRRPKRRGLLRNALVVIGNKIRRVAANEERVNWDLDSVCLEVNSFAETESDSMLREHSAWALANCSGGRRLAEGLYEREPDPETKLQISAHLEH